MPDVAAGERRAMTVLGFGEIDTTAPDDFSQNRPSLYADPVAWLMMAAVECAISDCPSDVAAGLSGGGPGGVDSVGVLMISDVCSTATMKTIRASAKRGRVSPLQFAGANPGGIASLVCIHRGFRGPTLVLAMAPAAGLTAARVVAGSWLAGGQADHVVLGVHSVADGSEGLRHTCRSAILAATDSAGDDVARLLVVGLSDA